MQIVNSPLAKDDLYVIVLASNGIDNDSIIYFVGMNCIQSKNMTQIEMTAESKFSYKDYIFSE